MNEFTDPRPRPSHNKAPNKKPSVGFASTLTFQAILCLTIVVGLVLLNTFCKDQYEDVDSYLKSQTQQTVDMEGDAKSVWDQVMSFVNSFTPIKSGDDSSSQATSSEDQSSASSDTSAVQSESSSAPPESTTAQGGAENLVTKQQVPANALLTSVSYDKKTTVLPLDTIQITSAFGFRTHPISQNDDFHNGVDLASPKDSKIYAIMAGKVVEAGYSNSNGYYLEIEHTDNTKSFYAHCEKLLVEKGDKVKKGETVAQVGSTGESTGYHLHFSFLMDGKYVNPMDIIPT